MERNRRRTNLNRNRYAREEEERLSRQEEESIARQEEERIARQNEEERIARENEDRVNRESVFRSDNRNSGFRRDLREIGGNPRRIRNDNDITMPLRRNLTVPLPEPPPNISFTHQNSAHGNYVDQYVAQNVGFRGGWNDFLEKARDDIINQLNQNRGRKVLFSITAKMKRIDGQFTTISDKNLRTVYPKIITEGTDLNKMYDEIMEELNEQMEALEDEGSGWTFEEIEKIDIHTVIYDPLRARSFLSLPKHIADKKAVINIQNKDEECFKWCIARAITPSKDNPHRVDKKLREVAKTLNMEGIRIPTPISDIKKFEDQNEDFAVVVLGINEHGSICLIQSSRYCHKRKHLVILLLIGNEKTDFHYTLVNKSSRLLSDQHSNHNGKVFRCWNCLNVFHDEKLYDYHTEQCDLNEPLILKMPEKGTVLKFKNHSNVRRFPFVIYCDIECLTMKMEFCDANPERKYTTKVQKHEPISYVLVLVSFDQNVLPNETIVYTGEDAMENLVIELEYISSKIYNLIPGKQKLNREDKENQANVNTCYVCGGYYDEDNKKRRDFCYYSGKYLGACHTKCLSKKIDFIPTFFHNLANYDSHLFITNLASKINGENLNCIPNNEQKYISFTKDTVVDYYEDKKTKTKKPIKFQLRFVDSFKFMSSGLASLADNLPDDKFINLEKRFTGEQLEMAKRKGVFPYDYFDSIEKLKEKTYPKEKEFDSLLTGKGISHEEYEFGLKAYNVYGFENLKDYLEIYNEIDTLLLADIFENFRSVCLENYKIDPAYYYTSPGLFWDAMLKETKVELELLSDIDMYKFFKRMIRGGISMISTRYAKANNPYMGKLYDPEKETSYVVYFDSNNLYGFIMGGKIPCNGFEWMKQEEMDYLFNHQTREEWEKMPCALEVDLEYPKEIHDLHNDLPCCPETIELEKKIKKLIPNLNNKEKYVIHYQTLLFVLSLGLKLEKIHNGIKFNETEWMKSYIDKNTELRTLATNEFEKDFFKLANNADFGKCLEDETKRCVVQLFSTQQKLKNLSAKTNFKGIKIFKENLVSVHMGLSEVKIKKPIYAGATILDKSKIPMFDFHYNYIKRKYGSKASLLDIDTDGVKYHIKTKDIYKDISEDVEEIFDTSNYSQNHPSGIKSGINKKVPGKFKDELVVILLLNMLD